MHDAGGREAGGRIYGLSGNSRAGGLDRGEAANEEDSERASGHDGLRLENGSAWEGEAKEIPFVF